ncbi:hypothetical protein F4777DRAFT_553547 [Nemania sp. FL0916]|nr:hypothetical protein F4777DRAFT_553547 [Nemania sp. FL0916]
MDDLDSDSTPPRPQPTRVVPPRQAKIKTPVRETRSSTARLTDATHTQTSASSSPETDTLPSPSTRVLRSSRPTPAKRKPTSTPSTPTKATKRPRAQLPTQTACRRSATKHDVAADAHANASTVSPTVFPPWHTLPWELWEGVFDPIAAPIRDITARLDDTAEAVATLLLAARVCKKWEEPALKALYRCPPFHHSPYRKKPLQVSLVQFLQTLAKPSSETRLNYKSKVKTLRLDVDAVLARKVGRQHLLLLKDIMENLPQLECLELYHPEDEPPFHYLDTHVRWKISRDDLLHALGHTVGGDLSIGDKETTATKLKSWRWNSRLVPVDLALDRLLDIHVLPSFQSLRKVVYVNYQLPSIRDFPDRARESEEAQASDLIAVNNLAASISGLPNLRHLVIESSTMANGSLLGRLPKTLTHLELVNCWGITSDDMSLFLLSHGGSLTRLTLKHCTSLSLAFLLVLGTSCPNLAHLEIDFTYYTHNIYARRETTRPLSATLLEEDQIPTWPSSIQSIEIIHMRNLSRGAASMFFESLMNNSNELPNLRRLVFKIMLNIEWRQRQELRRSWVHQMTTIFKRKSPPPREHRTLRQHPGEFTQDVDEIDTTNFPERRSTRLPGRPLKSASSGNGMVSSSRRESGRPLPVRRGLRPRKNISSAFDADDEDSSEDELSLADADIYRSKRGTTARKAADHDSEQGVHPLCDVVDIQIDNQRPTERQYEMDDFLDSPEESDPEWTGDEDFDAEVVV